MRRMADIGGRGEMHGGAVPDAGIQAFVQFVRERGA